VVVERTNLSNIIKTSKQVRPPKKQGKGESDEFLAFGSIWGQEGITGISTGIVQQFKKKEKLFKEKAEKIVRDAEKNAVQIEQDAYQKGYQEGNAKGTADGLAKYTAEVKRLGQVIGVVDQERKTFHTKDMEQLFMLVRIMVDRLVNHEVSVNPLISQAFLQKALQYVVENSSVKVYLNPDDFARIKEASLLDPALLEGRGEIQLIEEPSITMGGCKVETDFGEVDVTLDNCKEKLYEAVDQAFFTAMAES
jgi:flagellar assembly protein FliH